MKSLIVYITFASEILLKRRAFVTLYGRRIQSSILSLFIQMTFVVHRLCTNLVLGLYQ